MPYRVSTYKPPRLREAPSKRRENANERGYCSKAHKAWRKAVLTRDGFRCQRCKKIIHRDSEAHADHVQPIELGGSRYDLENGQCLCRFCHGVKTATETPRGQAGRYEKR